MMNRVRHLPGVLPGACLVLLLGAFSLPLHAGQSHITSDFEFGTWSPFVNRWQKSVSVCIWEEIGKPSPFRVQASSLNSSSRYALSNDVQDSIDYELRWTFAARNSSEQLFPGSYSRKAYKSDDRVRCENGPTGQLSLSIDKQSLDMAPTGRYSDTILLTISPL